MVHTRPPVSPPGSTLQRYARWFYTVLAALLAVGITSQVLFVGLAVLVDPVFWETHVAFGFGLGVLPVLLFGVGLAARYPAKVLLLTALTFGLWALQLVLIELPAPVRALHAVNALSQFWLALYLARTSLTRAGRLATP